MTARIVRPEALTALGIIGIGLVAFWQSGEIPVSPIYAKVGPTVVAYAASGGLIALGALLLLQALRGIWAREPEADEAPLHPMNLLWLGLGLVLNAGLIEWLGFIPASCLLFICTARAFGSRKWLRDLGIGFVFAAIAYFGFGKLLGINIGAGLLEGII